MRREQLLDDARPRQRPVEEFLEENRAALHGAVRDCVRLLPADSAPLLTLSSGFDSRRLLGGLLEQGRTPKIYTVPIIQSDGTESEAEVAKRVAGRLGIPCHVVLVDALSSLDEVRRVRDLITDFESHEHLWSAMLTMAVGPHNSVNFDGFAGDVFVGGAYVKPGYFSGSGDFERKFFRERVGWMTLPETDPPLSERVRRFLAPFREHPHWTTLFYFYAHSLRGTSLASTNLQGTSFESLMPYTHRDFVTSGLSMSPELLRERNFQRESLAVLDPALVDVPFEGETERLREMGLVAHYPHWRLRRRAHELVAGHSERSGGLGLVRSQTLKLRIYSYLGSFLPPDFLRWQFHKAMDARRLSHFLSMSGSASDYARGIRFLDGRFAGRPEWVTRYD